MAVALAGLLSVALRLPFRSVPLITDEGGYAYVAHWLGHGLSLYRDLWFDRPQAIFVVYRLQMALLGESTEAIRLGAALYNAVTTVVVFTLGAALSSRRTGLVAATLFAVGSASPVIEGFTANGELYMNLPVAGALLLAVRRRWFWAGVAAALACAVKPTAVASVGPALLVLLASSPRRVADGLSAAAGAACGAAPFVVHGVLIDPGLYWYSIAGFRLGAHSAFSVGDALLSDFVQTAPTALAALAPVWLLAGLGAARAWHTRAGRVAATLLGGSAVGAAAGGYWYWHYYVALVPPAALLAGLALDRPPAWRRRAVAAAGVAGVAAAVSIAMHARVIGGTPEQTSLRLYGRPAYVAARELAAYVRERTTHEDTIYAAFAQADLYHLAHRRAAARQLYWTEINRVPGAFEALIGALDDPGRRPRYVIGIDAALEEPDRAAPFWERVARYYTPEREIGGFTVFRATGTTGETGATGASAP